MLKVDAYQHLDVEGEKIYTKEAIGTQLDAFQQEQGLWQSLRDRLNIGLNEVGMLAFEKTRKTIVDICRKFADTQQEAAEIYIEVQGMCVDIQKSGPWDYAQELNNPNSKASRIWHILTYAGVRDYKKDDKTKIEYGNARELNDDEFFADLDRIEGNLYDAIQDPDEFFNEARDYVLEGVDNFNVRLESFATKIKKRRGGKKETPAQILTGEKVKTQDWDIEEFVPIADNLGGFLTMALKGAEAGITQDSDGFVFVGARGEISNDLIESCGLKKEIGADDRDPKRTVTYFTKNGQKILKKIHAGFLVFLNKSKGDIELGKSIVQAIAHKREVVQVAEDVIGHNRVIQTSEARRNKEDIERDWLAQIFLQTSEIESLSSLESRGTGMVSLKKQFYLELLNIRSKMVYLDALSELEKKRARNGEKVTELDRENLIRAIVSKMKQKVEELQYINELLAEHFSEIPRDIHRIIDMAGGAGDLGLGIATQFLAEGRKVDHIEIVDPQKGTDHFMHVIVDNIPFRPQLKSIVHHALEHSSGYLQEANLTPDAMVVEKHACGTLADDSLDLWTNSDSKMFLAMTCCQDKACGHPARYGIPQSEWDRLTTESGWTNLEDQIAFSTGNKKKNYEEKMAKGKKAMEILDLARVNYLRRRGFQAELYTTDRFPKGDVIIARRLPDDFMVKLKEIKHMKRNNPIQFDNLRIRLDTLLKGHGSVRGAKIEDFHDEFGKDWVIKDFIELDRRLNPTKADIDMKKTLSSLKERAIRERDRIKQEEARKREVAEKKSLEKKLMSEIFGDTKGRIDLYIRKHAELFGVDVPPKQFGKVINVLKKKISDMKDKSPEEIRTSLDLLMQEMGY